jgi:hypothetical protein
VGLTSMRIPRVALGVIVAVVAAGTRTGSDQAIILAIRHVG